MSFLIATTQGDTRYALQSISPVVSPVSFVSGKDVGSAVQATQEGSVAC